MTKFKIAMAVMAAVMVLSTSAVAFAQTPNPPTPPTPPTAAQTFWQTLADKLGVTVDKLQGAVRDALKSVVAQLLKDGKLTQQQADNADSRIDQFSFNQLPFGGFFGGRGPGFGRGMMGIQGILDAAAQKLGMTSQALLTELRSGKTLADVAKEKNVSTDDLKAAIVNTVGAQLDQAVKDGKLTQAQADRAKTQLNNLSLDQAWFNRGPGKMPAARFALGQEVLNAAAQKLGMTLQDLTTELRSGKTLTEVAKEKSVSSDDLKAAIITAVDAKIDQAVKDGTLTQTQADQIKAQVNQMNLDNLFGRGFGPGRGGFFPPFGRRGFRGPQPAIPQGSSS
jgi:polyhydroxyalkanoate synthesis regulator phasin